MKKFLSFILLINLLSAPVMALALDTTIDDEIRRTYNPSKIEQDNALPALPKILDEKKVQSATVQKPITQKSVTVTRSTNVPISNLKKVDIKKINANYPAKQYKATVKTVPEGSYITLKQGTKLKLKLMNSVSDKSRRGTKLTFVLVYPVTTTYFTIPMGTIFKGEIIESHRPQLSGNGGLISININSMILKNETKPINAHVTKVNSRKVFFNDIKGKRKYLSSMSKSLKPGAHFFNKMMYLTVDLAHEGSSVVLSPFSLFSGVVVLGANAIVSPALAMFHKGESICIHEGSLIEAKLSQDVFVYN